MAKSILDIVVNVVDGASSRLKGINSGIKETGNVAKKTSFDMIQFNRVMFSTTAYLGLLQKNFQFLSTTIQKGADFSRVSGQFEAILGPKGELFKQLDSFSGTAIDKIEAMRSGIALKTLGIVSDVGQLKTVLVGAGIAAKRAGLDSSEGIKKFTQALKDGNLSNLEFLNLIRTNSPALKANLAILSKYSGVMGSAITAQQKNAIILKVLNSVVATAGEDQEDLYDVTFRLSQGFDLLKSSLGEFLGNALTPFMKVITKGVDKLRDFFDTIKNNKNLQFLVTSTMAAVSAIGALASATFLLGNAFKMLGSLGFGLPKVIILLSTLALTFAGVTNQVQGINEKFQVFGAFLKGIYQLVESLDEKSGFSKIDEDIANLLNKYNLLGFTKNVARAFSTVKSFLTGFGQGIWATFKSIDDLTGGFANKLLRLLGLVDKPWPKSLLEWSKQLGKTIGIATAGIFGLISAFKLIGAGKGLLSSLPIVGRYFGGGGVTGKSGPSGSASDPIYTRSTEGALGSILGKTSLSVPTTGGLGRQVGILSPILTKLTGLFSALATPLGAVIAALAAAGFAVGAGYVNMKNTEKSWADQSVGKYAKESVYQNYSQSNYSEEQTTRLKEFFGQMNKNTPGFTGMLTPLEFQSLGEEITSGDESLLPSSDLILSDLAAKRKERGVSGAGGNAVRLTHMPTKEMNTSAEREKYLLEEQKELGKEQSSIIKEGMSLAMQEDSSQGQDITKEELAAIIMAAINNSDVKKALNNLRQSKLPTTPGC